MGDEEEGEVLPVVVDDEDAGGGGGGGGEEVFGAGAGIFPSKSSANACNSSFCRPVKVLKYKQESVQVIEEYGWRIGQTLEW